MASDPIDTTRETSVADRADASSEAANTRRLTGAERGRMKHLDDEAMQIREVFAYFGLAMYQVEVFNHGIVNLLTIAGLSKGTLHPRDFDRYQDKRFSEQLAELVRRTQPYLGQDTSLFADVSAAVATRNWLAHDYFRDRAVEFITWTGRRQMLDELRSTTERVEDLDRRVHVLVLAFGHAHGITQPAIDAMYAQMKASSDLIDNLVPPAGQTEQA